MLACVIWNLAKHSQENQDYEIFDPCDYIDNPVALARIQAGITQEKLSFDTGVDRTYISYIERGERNPSLFMAWRLAKALKVKLNELTDF